jgi:hypothetical protein
VARANQSQKIADFDRISSPKKYLSLEQFSPFQVGGKILSFTP